MPLTDAQVRNVKPQAAPRKYSDGGGLYLLVTPTGSKLWRMAYRFGGKQKVLAFGTYPTVSLADARERRQEAKKLIQADVDPSVQIKLEKATRRVAFGNTFSAIADEFIRKIEREGRADATIVKKKWLVELSRGDLGNRPIAEITAAEILIPLRKVEALGNYETARRMRSTIGQVFLRPSFRLSWRGAFALATACAVFPLRPPASHSARGARALWLRDQNS